MSKAASMKQFKAMPVDKMPETPSTMSVNVKKHGAASKVPVGKTVKLHVTAKVTEHHHDKYGHSQRMEIQDMQVGDGSGEDDDGQSARKR